MALDALFMSLIAFGQKLFLSLVALDFTLQKCEEPCCGCVLSLIMLWAVLMTLVVLMS